MNEQLGPRLSDLDFFTSCIDPAFPGCEGLADMARRGDVDHAKKTFAAVARSSLQPGQFFKTVKQGRRENDYTHPNETIHDACERILKLELISCGVPMQFDKTVDWFANPTHNQYGEWTWQLSRHWEWDLLAEQYQATGDERFAAGFAALFTSWVQQAIVPENAPSYATLCWRTIEAGIRMGRPWPRALHTFYRSPAFTDELLVNFYKSVYEHAWRLRNFHFTHNWLIMEMNGLCHIGVLFPMFREATSWREYALSKLVQELKKQVYADGMQFELSTNYHQVNIRNYLMTWHILEAYDYAVPPEFSDVIERMHDANLRLMMPDGRLPDVNDGAWCDVASLMGDAVRNHPDRADFLWARTRSQKGSPPDYNSTAFDNCGYFVSRTGWNENSLYTFFDAGDFGFAHQHEDKLNVLIHAHGRLLLTEAGNYAYDGSPMRKYVLSTRGHNTVRVDGLDQNRGTAFQKWRKSPTDDELIAYLNHKTTATWIFAPDRDCITALHDEGYGPDASPIATHRRTLLVIKRPPAGLSPFCIVIDDFHPADTTTHTYQALWHFNTQTAAVCDDNPMAIVSHDPDQPNLAIIATQHPNMTARIIAGQTDPEWLGWKATGTVQGHYTPTPTAEYVITAAGVQQLITLLYPVPAGESCPIRQITLDNGQLILAENHETARISLPVLPAATVIV